MVWQNVSPAGYKNFEAYYRLFVWYLKKSGWKQSLKVPEWGTNTESFLCKLESSFFSYNRFSIDTPEFSYDSLNQSGYVKWNFYDFATVCFCWLDLAKMELYDLKVAREWMDYLLAEGLAELLEEEDMEESLVQGKEIAECILAIYRNDKKAMKEYKNSYAVGKYLSTYQYTDDIIQNLGSILGFGKKETYLLLPDILNFFTTPLNDGEMICEYSYKTSTGEEEIYSSDTCRMIQVFHISQVSKLKNWLTNEEMEELLHPVNSFGESFRKVFHIGKNDIYVLYTSLSLDYDSVPVSYSNVNPAAVAVGYKLREICKEKN